MYAEVNNEGFKGPTPAEQTVLRGGTHTLSCSQTPLDADDNLQWTDETGETSVLIYNGTTKLTEVAKYDNFAIGNPDSNTFNLQITNSQVEDEGIYQCLLGSTGETQSASLSVEGKFQHALVQISFHILLTACCYKFCFVLFCF